MYQSLLNPQSEDFLKTFHAESLVYLNTIETEILVKHHIKRDTISYWYTFKIILN